MDEKMRVVVEVGGQPLATSSDLGVCAAVLRLIDAEGKGTLDTVLGEGFPVSPSGDPESRNDTSAESRLARDLGVTVAELQGAVDPTDEPPFIRVNKRNWEMMMRAVTRKGKGAVAPFAVLMTCLALWKDYADLGRATYEEGGALLKDLGLVDKSRRRSVGNCDWLMDRGREVVLNPAEISQAFGILELLCRKGQKREG